MDDLTQQDDQKFSDWWAEKVNLVKQCRMDKPVQKRNTDNGTATSDPMAIFLDGRME